MATGSGNNRKREEFTLTGRRFAASNMPDEQKAIPRTNALLHSKTKSRRSRRDLDPATIERAVKKELEKKKKNTGNKNGSPSDEKRQQLPESPRRKLKPNAVVQSQSKNDRRRRSTSRSKSPHKAHVLGEYNSEEEDLEVDYEEDFLVADEDDILGITIDDDGDLEEYMDPEARANLRRHKDQSSDEDTDDSDEGSEDDDDDRPMEKNGPRRISIFQRFRSTSPSRRRTSDIPIVSPSRNPFARITKSLSPGNQSRRKVRAKQTDGSTSSSLRRSVRRGSGTLHTDDNSHQSAGSQMVRRLSGSFETIKLALDGLGSQQGSRASHQPWRRSRQLGSDDDDDDRLENFDWDENRHLTKEEMEYFERMYNEIEQLDL